MTLTQQLVAGVLSTPKEPLDSWVTNSDTGAELTPARASSVPDVDAALAAAEATHLDGRWRGLTGAERAEHLLRFSEQLTAIAEQLAEADSKDSGVPLSTTRLLCAGATMLPGGIGQLALSLVSSDAEGASGPVAQRWLPWGPAAVFAPWNAPTSIALSKASFALAAGAPVILKPSEWSQRSASLLAQAAQAAELPDGVFQVVHGAVSVGQQLAADSRVAALSYTGGSTGGRAVAAASAGHLRPLDLELSGSNAVLLLPDADLDTAAAEIVEGMLFLNGQWCAGPTRVIVRQASAEALAEAVLDRLSAVRVGASTDPSTQLGPLAHSRHRDALEQQLVSHATHGGTVRRVGALAQGSGFFFAPAVITGRSAETIHDELFGPVITIQGYDDVDDGVRRANQGMYGLAAYVFSSDWEAAVAVGEQLRAGVIGINKVRPMHAPPTPDAAASMWSGSGLGTIGMTESLRFFTGARLIH